MRLTGTTSRDLEPRLLVDEPRDLGGERQEIRHRAAMQDEEHELLGLAPGGRTPAATTLPSSRPADALRDRLEIVRVVVLAVDEDDLLRPPGDIEVPLVDERRDRRCAASRRR